MNNFSLKGKKGIDLFVWLIVACAIALSIYKYPVTRSYLIGDEGYYSSEVAHFAKYGAYNALAQGTSFFYTVLVYAFSSLCNIGYVVGARILALLSFVLCCVLISGTFRKLKDAPEYSPQVAVSFFVAMSIWWLPRGVPDFVATAIILCAFNMLYNGSSYARIAIIGVLLFVIFAIKPSYLPAVPCFMVFIFCREMRQSSFLVRSIKTIVLPASFTILFILYHIPGFQVYNKLMLEDKSHSYAANGTRVETTTKWGELNAYYVLHNPNHRVNKWTVTWEEVIAFKEQHPEIDLNVGVTDYMFHHTALWLKSQANYLFLTLPYFIQSGFFFYKWTIVNSVLHSGVLVYLVTSLLIAVLCFAERKFIAKNWLYIGVNMLFFAALSAMVMTQLELNWMFFCLPIIASPVVVFFTRRLNIYLLLGLQFIYIILLV